MKLFFNPKKKNYYYIPENELICNLCNKPIIRACIVCFNWNVKNSSINNFCIDCIPKLNKKVKPTIGQKILCLLVSKVQKNAFPIFIRPPELRNLTSNISVFDAGHIEFRKADNPHANYHQLRCMKPVLRSTIEEIDMDKVKREVDKRILELDTEYKCEDRMDERLESHLDSIVNSKHLIEHKEVLKIEDKKKRKSNTKRKEK